MLHLINDYSLELGQRVECYYNSKNKMVSIRSIDTRNKDYLKIVAYSEYIHLVNVQFVYSATNNRKIIKGNYAGNLPIVPNIELLILHNEKGFFSTSGKEVEGSEFAVLYKDLVMAEQLIEKGAEVNGQFYKKRVL